MDEKTRNRILDWSYQFSQRHLVSEEHCPQVKEKFDLHKGEHLYVDLNQLQEFIKRI